MKENKEKIDLLIEKNTAEQLSQINWEQLNTAISSRLDEAQRKESSSIKFPSLLKIAASIAVVATILLTVPTILEKPQNIRFTRFNYRLRFGGITRRRSEKRTLCSWACNGR